MPDIVSLRSNSVKCFWLYGPFTLKQWKHYISLATEDRLECKHETCL